MFILLNCGFECVYGSRTFGFVMVYLITLLIAYIIHKTHFYYIPESAGAMLVGFLMGIFLSETSIADPRTLEFEAHIFFFVLLPPILLEAGYSIQTGPFFGNIGIISLLAVLGTILSSLITGAGIYYGRQMGLFEWDSGTEDAATGEHTNVFLECLLFGVLLSAIDPIATLAILGAAEVGAPVLLYALIFGESVLNDAIAVVLFEALEPFIDGGSVTAVSILETAGWFIVISLGSIAIGVGCGIICSFVFLKANFTELSEMEFLVIFLFCYGSYGLASWGHLSGIMAIFFCGITISRYTFKAASIYAKWSTTLGFKAIATAADMFVFMYLGIQAALAMQLRPEGVYKWDAALTFWALLWILIARGVTVFLFVNVANTRRQVKIPFRMQIMMWFAGLRGAISFALALNFPTANRGVVITVTISVVVITTFVFGGLTAPLFKLLNIRGDGKTHGPPTGFIKKLASLEDAFMQRFFGAAEHPESFVEQESRKSIDQVRRTSRNLSHVVRRYSEDLLATGGRSSFIIHTTGGELEAAAEDPFQPLMEDQPYMEMEMNSTR